MPVLEHARLVASGSSAQRSGDGGGPIHAYWTHRVYDLPVGVTPAAALRFYRRELVRSGWRVVGEGVDHLNLGRGASGYLHVLAGRGRLYVIADYDCPTCLATH